MTADPERDGLTNLFEYATDSHPLIPDVSRLPRLRFVDFNDQVYAALEFVIVKWATDLQYRVEASDALIGAWTQIDLNAPGNLTAVQDNAPAFGLKTVSIRDNVPMDGRRRFMRLRITKSQ
jgi:hypothetical protein